MQVELTQEEMASWPPQAFETLSQLRHGCKIEFGPGWITFKVVDKEPADDERR
ncbi:hypothetical protein CcrBL47_gp394 [Caulobacter phage BL47]|nr:hypothetical protein CcrBL47_gp394 [Caulobacter phage BL47]